MKPTKEELIEELKKLANEAGDPESTHGRADALLLAYIDDPIVTEIFGEIEKWYA